MELSGLLGVMLQLFLYICFGFLCSKTGMVDEAGSRSLNKIVLNICSPALVLKAVLEAEITYAVSDILLLIVFAVVFMIVALLTGFAMSFLFVRKKERRCMFTLVSAFGNVAFMGFPVVNALFGASAVFLVSICTIPFNIFVFSIGIFLVLGGKTEKVSFRRIFLTPTMLCTFVAFFFFLFRVSLPVPIEKTIGALGSMVVPLSMMLIGMSLSRMNPGRVFGNLQYYFVCIAKLIAVPVCVALVLRPIVKDSMMYGILVVMSCMPSAAITPVLSTEYGGDVDFASSSVFLTTSISMLTVPVMLSVLL